MDETEYKAEINRWRETLNQTLRKENSWLALAGLFWLHQGTQTFGSGPDVDIVLPGKDVPASWGTIRLHEGQLHLEIADGLPVLVDGIPATKADLRTDLEGSPSIVEYGSLRWVVIERGERYAIRLWDNSRPERELFPGRKWYPINPDLRRPAIFEPYEEARLLTLPGADGNQQEIASIGFVTFHIGAQECRLEALEGPADGLFLIFRDLTNGERTYKAGRYLTTLVPEQGALWLDFNRAYNPPCAFTGYATCALPPSQNALSVRIEAGELYPG